MAARGRKSAASLNIVSMPINSKPRISARADAPAEVKGLFAEIVASVDRTHWQTADSYLVKSYCRAIF